MSSGLSKYSQTRNMRSKPCFFFFLRTLKNRIFKTCIMQQNLGHSGAQSWTLALTSQLVQSLVWHLMEVSIRHKQ